MEVNYRKFDPDRGEWVTVTSLDEIPDGAIPHVFGLQYNDEFECQEPLEHAGTWFRVWAAQDSSGYSFNPMSSRLSLRLQQAELDKEYWKEQAGEVAQRDARFKRVAGMRRDEIQKALVVVMTKLAEAFEGSHSERHVKMAKAMTQIYEVSALCEKIPDLLRDAADDIPF